MRVSHERDKLINAMVFFAKNTRHCGKIKLFKLLYLLDFEHFAQTGRAVTGLSYQAWKNGPVPRALYEEWNDPDRDFTDALEIKRVATGDYTMQLVRAIKDFDEDNFTKRELGLMHQLAEQYRDARSVPMVKATHVANGAWAKVWAEPGNDNPIPYTLAVPGNSPYRKAVLESADEYSRINI
ncbi:Panacea domain-containing protein [Dyella sp. 2RAB6]|uniref:Panacea domain-containing protein n=1 Tax=Dyella sp. 2RAB6 TaxID=3232992 RepID=UPI003F8EB10A